MTDFLREVAREFFYDDTVTWLVTIYLVAILLNMALRSTRFLRLLIRLNKQAP